MVGGGSGLGGGLVGVGGPQACLKVGVGGSQAFGGALREELGSSGLCVGAQVGMGGSQACVWGLVLGVGGLRPVCRALR